MTKKEIINGLEKRMISSDEDLNYFCNEYDMFQFFYKRYDFAFLDIYKFCNNEEYMHVEVGDNLKFLLEKLKKDDDFNNMWNVCKGILLINFMV